MVAKFVIDGFEKLNQFIVSHEGEKIALLFTGAATEKTASWCPDCLAAEPIIEKALKEVEGEEFNFARVIVGSREEWKDPKSPFRTDARLKLTSVPTLLIWGTSFRLNDTECQNIENVRMIFEEM